MLTESSYGFPRPRPIPQASPSSSSYLDGVLASTVFDLDATIAASYPGSGTTWANLVAAPADGAGQTEYDLYLGNGATSTTYPTFNGSAGNNAAYWTVDGGDYFTLKSGSNTAFLNGLSRTDAGTWWMALTFNSIDGVWATGAMLATANGNAVGDTGLFLRSTISENFQISQSNGASVRSVSLAKTYTTGNSILILSHDQATGVLRYWQDTTTKTETAMAFYANTSNANGALRLFAETDLGALQPAGNYRLYSLSMGNSFIDDTQAAAIITHLNARHARTYV